MERPQRGSAAGDASRFASAMTPLWQGDRGTAADFVRWGAFAVVDADGRLLASAGSPDLRAFMRSSAKPFQASAFLRRGLARTLGLGAAEIACACASHQGEERHVAAARRILGAAGVDETLLLCGTHEPLDQDLAARVRLGDEQLLPIHNNCSGKHAAMLATCRAAGWAVESYTEPDHPLQRENATTLATLANLPPAALTVAVDNCTVPTFALPLRSAALAAARLVDPRGVPPELAEAGLHAVDAMVAEPGFVGGVGRLDTHLMETGRGDVLGKTGANGYYLAARRPRGSRPGLGFALKLAGAEGEVAKAPVIIAALEAGGLIESDEAEALRRHHASESLSCRGAVIGRGRFVGVVRTS